MLRTTPLQPSIALDRNKASRTKQGEGEEEVGKTGLISQAYWEQSKWYFVTWQYCG